MRKEEKEGEKSRNESGVHAEIISPFLFLCCKRIKISSLQPRAEFFWLLFTDTFLHVKRKKKERTNAKKKRFYEVPNIVTPANITVFLISQAMLLLFSLLSRFLQIKKEK